MSADPVALLEAEWEVFTDLVDGLTGSDWDTPTALPGWTVKDCLSHVVGVERTLLGDPRPEVEVEVDRLPHVNNPVATYMEVDVEARRGLSGEVVRSEWHETVGRRGEALRALDPAELDVEVVSPIGRMPQREFLGIRLFDTWMHEQDIRLALRRPGNLTGTVAEAMHSRFVGTLAYVVGRKAALPEGATVRVAVNGGPVGDIHIGVVAGRGTSLDQPTPEPDIVLSLPFATLAALVGGRSDGVQARRDGGLVVSGDEELADRILGSMAVTP